MSLVRVKDEAESLETAEGGRGAPLDYDSVSLGIPEGPVLTSIDWTPEIETQFFKAYLPYKPTGVNGHFHMLLGYQRFVKAINRNVDVDLLWDKLYTMYNFDNIERVERVLLFPNEQRDFELPRELLEEYLPYKIVEKNAIED